MYLTYQSKDNLSDYELKLEKNTDYVRKTSIFLKNDISLSEITDYFNKIKGLNCKL